MPLIMRHILFFYFLYLIQLYLSCYYYLFFRDYYYSVNPRGFRYPSAPEQATMLQTE